MCLSTKSLIWSITANFSLSLSHMSSIIEVNDNIQVTKIFLCLVFLIAYYQGTLLYSQIVVTYG